MQNIFTLNEKEKIAVKEFKVKLLERLKNKIVLIKLFGSKARGDFRKDSDIDILIVLKGEDRIARNEVYDLATEILLERDIYISVKVFFESEFRYLNSIPTIFMQFVNKEGIDLWKTKK